MKTKPFAAAAISLAATGILVNWASRSRRTYGRFALKNGASIDRETINRLIADLPPRPRVGALQMLTQYGTPQEATAEQLIWHNVGPFKRITVTRAEHHHDFPFPHMDFLEHTIDYHVPAEKAGALCAYDSSLTFDRTRGEMSARCDLEGHNILTLNLAHEIVTGNKDTEEARRVFSQTVLKDWAGAHPEYVERLHFEPGRKPAAYPDTSTIPGVPKRVAVLGGDVKTRGDAEVLAFTVAANLNEILAATQASKKELTQEVRRYATMLHKEHGANLQKTLEVGQAVGVTPVLTEAVDALLVKGARELAKLVPLEGESFDAAYIGAMVKTHTEVLNMIDHQLLEKADAEAVKQHLKETRAHVARHLQAAREMQPAMRR